MVVRKKTDTVTLTLRMTEDLRKRLEKEAKSRRVSLNGEIIKRLDDSFKAEQTALIRSQVRELSLLMREMTTEMRRIAIDDYREQPDFDYERQVQRAKENLAEFQDLEAEAIQTGNPKLIAALKDGREKAQQGLDRSQRWLEHARKEEQGDTP